MFRKYIYVLLLCMLTIPSFAAKKQVVIPQEILQFDTMYAVDGAFLTPQGDKTPNIRGIVGDYQAWKINNPTHGRLFSNGRLIIDVHGLVFPNAPNDEDHFRALVSCLTSHNGRIVTRNVITPPFPTGPEGNANINAHLQIPRPCVAPIVMILNGDSTEGNAWFAISGF